MIKFIKKAFWFPFSSKSKIEKYQKEIRDIEWNALKKYITENASFLDVGCGAGDNLNRAKTEFNCKVTGIDPSPGEHGVGRFTESNDNNLKILQGSAENLPFENESFDIVFCSHVLEHVTNQTKSLAEIKRVTKNNGTIIIGMPTASMALIALISHFLFTTHINIYFFLKSIGRKDMIQRFVHIFIPASHSIPNHTYIFHDLLHYRIYSWKKTISTEFKIVDTLTPCLYPYPDYIQWFPKIREKGVSSSVFFICEKK